jgi:Ni/Co efflux regulator RcnB
MLATCAAVAVTALFALPAPAGAAAAKGNTPAAKSATNAEQIDISAARRHHRHHARRYWRHHRGYGRHYYRPYYRTYGYGYAPYYYRPYYAPGPFVSFGPFGFGFGW